MLRANSNVTEIPLIGDAKATLLENLSIRTVKDILFHIPYKYRDTSQVISILEFKNYKEGTILAQIVDVKNSYLRGRRVITRAKLTDEKDTIYAVWFNQPYLEKALKKGEWYLFEGKIPDKPKAKDISNPSYEIYTGEQTHVGTITPYYNETAGISSKWLRSRIKHLQKDIDRVVEESLPKEIIEKYKVKPLNESIKLAHFPKSFKEIEIGRARLAFDEMLSIAIPIEKEKHIHSKREAPKIKSEDVLDFISNFPFTLTDDQTKTIKEILDDISKPIPMKRLLNGDVGSGKTAVAATAIYATHLAKRSTLFMAPTTILAQQHYNTLKPLLEPTGMTVELRISGTSLDDIPEDSLIIGTHALLHEPNLPEDIALVVIDEQHRFGVEQRNQLLRPLPNGQYPHYLTMTATPIPRTLTNVLFGDMDVSVIKQMPKGRKPVTTYAVPHKKRDDCFNWLSNYLTENSNQQAFIIFPLIEESEKITAKAATTEYEYLTKNNLKNHKVALLHGQMKQEEKDNILKDFRNKKYQILISTTVIEVGIDIPDATVMVIENAERFGLAQLHQLRGRVGRNDQESYCYLIAGEEIETESETFERLKYFSKHNSGFDVAQYDLQKRGPGEVYGLKQSGIPNFKVASINDIELLSEARTVAKDLVKKNIDITEKLFK